LKRLEARSGVSADDAHLTDEEVNQRLCRSAVTLATL